MEEEVGSRHVRIEPTSLWLGLWNALQHMAGVERIGFETDHLLHRDFARLLEQGSRWQWRPQEDLVETLRERKDAGEVAAIEEAVAMAEQALDRTLRELRPGLTETAVAGVLERHLREAGSEAYPFASIVASGARSALPMRGPATGHSARVICPAGLRCRGVLFDITRTVVLGRASAEQREVYEIVREANGRASVRFGPE